MLLNYLYVCVIFGLCLPAAVKSYRILPGNVSMYLIKHYTRALQYVESRKLNDDWCHALHSPLKIPL